MRLDHLLSKEEEVRVLYTVESWIKRFKGIPVAMRFGETPVLIPNTKVKTETADGTMLETAWESRWLPEHLIRTSRRGSSNLVSGVSRHLAKASRETKLEVSDGTCRIP